MPEVLNVTVFPEKRHIEVPRGIQIQECLGTDFDECGQKVVAARIGNEFASLTDSLLVDCELKPVTLDEAAGQRIYRNSLIFLFEMVIHRLYSGHRIVIGHSIGHGFFYRFQDDRPSVSEEETQAIENTMREIVEEDLSIVPDEMSWADTVEYFRQRRCQSTLRLVQELNDPRMKIWRSGRHIALRHSPLVKSTGILTDFAVEPYAEGLRLKYPPSPSSHALSDGSEETQLYAVYKEYKRWGEILGVSNVSSLNTLSRHRSAARDFILTAEALHDRKIAEVGEMIVKRSAKVKSIMIAGPSSSGKTTFMKKLALSLKSNGLRPQLISLDDYYKEKENIPQDEHGKPDLEALEALDLTLFNENLTHLLDGKEAEVPIFDFKKAGGRLPEGRKIRLSDNSVLLYEGIHALNPHLTPKLDNDTVFRIYISALTPLNMDDHVRIPTTDNRLIRRIVRDHQFRRYPAIKTLKVWPSVRRGEEKHIFPWQGSADVMFNSALDYELAVLKMFAEPLLRTVSPAETEYGEARRLMAFLRKFQPFPVEEVPPYSILREFIGRSGFRY